MADVSHQPQLDVATLLHLVSTPSDFDYEFEPEDFDLLEKIIATDVALQKIVDTVQLHLLENMSMQNLGPTENVSAKPVSIDADLRHSDGCAAGSDDKPEDIQMSRGSTDSAMKVEPTPGSLQQLLAPIPHSSSGHYHNTERSGSSMRRPKDMSLVHRSTGSAHRLQQTAGPHQQSLVEKASQGNPLAPLNVLPLIILPSDLHHNPATWSSASNASKSADMHQLYVKPGSAQYQQQFPGVLHQSSRVKPVLDRSTLMKAPSGYVPLHLNGNVAGPMYRPQDMQVLQGTTGNIIYLPQTPGMPSNYSQPHQMAVAGTNRYVANMELGHNREQVSQGRMSQEQKNIHLQCKNSQFINSNTSKLNIKLNSKPLPSSTSQMVNRSPPSIIQTGDQSNPNPQITSNIVAADSTCNQSMMDKLLSRKLTSAIELLPVISSPINRQGITKPDSTGSIEAKVLKTKPGELHSQQRKLPLNSIKSGSIWNQRPMKKLESRKLSSTRDPSPVDLIDNDIRESTSAEQTTSYKVDILKSKSRDPPTVQKRMPSNKGASDSPCNQFIMGTLAYREQDSVIKLFPVVPSTMEFWKNDTTVHVGPQGDEILKLKVNDICTQNQEIPLNSKSGYDGNHPILEAMESEEFSSIEEMFTAEPPFMHIQESTMTENHKEILKSKPGDIATQCQQVTLNDRAEISFYKHNKMGKLACGDVIHTGEEFPTAPSPMDIGGSCIAEPKAFHEEKVLEKKDGGPLIRHQNAQFNRRASNSICNRHMLEKLVSGNWGMNREQSTVISLTNNVQGNIKAHHAEPHEANILNAVDPHTKYNQNALNSRKAGSVGNQIALGNLPSEELGAVVPPFPNDTLPMNIWESTKTQHEAPCEEESLKPKSSYPPTKCQQIPFNNRAADSTCKQLVMGKLASGDLGAIVELFPADSAPMNMHKSSTAEQAACDKTKVLTSEAQGPQTEHQQVTISIREDSSCKKPVKENLTGRQQDSTVELFSAIPHTMDTRENRKSQQEAPYEDYLKSKVGDSHTQCLLVSFNNESASSTSYQLVMGKLASGDVGAIADLFPAESASMTIDKNTIAEEDAHEKIEVLNSEAADPQTLQQQANLNTRTNSNCKKPKTEKLIPRHQDTTLELFSAMPHTMDCPGSSKAQHESFCEDDVPKSNVWDSPTQSQRSPFNCEDASSTSYQLIMGKLASGDLGAIAELFIVTSPPVDIKQNTKADLVGIHEKKVAKTKARDSYKKGKQATLKNRASSSICNQPITAVLETRELTTNVAMFPFIPPTMGNVGRIKSEDAAPTEKEVLKLNDMQTTQCQQHSRHLTIFDPVRTQSGALEKTDKKVTAVPLLKNPGGFDPSAALKKRKHLKVSKDNDRKVIKDLHKKPKEMASTKEQPPTESPRNNVCTLNPGQNTDCQILSANKSPPTDSTHTISSARKHEKNDRKRKAVKDVNISSSRSNTQKSLPKREYKPSTLETDCTTAHPLDNPKVEEKTKKKSKKRKKKHKKSKQESYKHNQSQRSSEMHEYHDVFQKPGIKYENTERTNVPQKTTNLPTEGTKKRLSKVSKKRFLFAKSDPIPFKKPKLNTTETISAINEFMKQRLLDLPATSCKHQTAVYSRNDPVLEQMGPFNPDLASEKTMVSSNKNQAASFKIPKRPTFSKEFIDKSHRKRFIDKSRRKQSITECPAENKGPNMAFLGQGPVLSDMAQSLIPSGPFPKTIYGPLNRHSSSTSRASIQDGSYHTLFTQRPYVREAPIEDLPGQSAIHGRLAEASKPAFPFNRQMQVPSNYPPISMSGIQFDHNQLLFQQLPVD